MGQIAPFIVAAGKAVGAYVAANAATLAINVAISAGLGYIAGRLQKTNVDDGGQIDITHTTRGTALEVRLIFGAAVVAGQEVFGDSILRGADNYDLHFADAIAPHECDDIVDVYLDDYLARGGVEIDWAQSRITVGKYAVAGDTAVMLRKHLGTTTQTADAELLAVYPTKWTSAHPGKEYTYCVPRFRMWSGTQALWEPGAPQNRRYLVHGFKLYNARLDSTNGGTGAHRMADPSTWQWSSNPVDILVFYLCFCHWGPRWGTDEINWPSVIVAANHCDVLVDTPFGTQKRFECNGVLSGAAQFLTNVEHILASFNGTLRPTGATWTVEAGVYYAPDLALTEKDLRDTISLEAQGSRLDRFNTIKCLFTDSDNHWLEQETPEQTDVNYLERDNDEVLLRTVKAPLCNNWFQAQRLNYTNLRLGNQQKRVHFPGNLRCVRVAPGQRIELDVAEWSYDNKVFIVEEIQFEDMERCDLVLREDSASAWEDPPLSFYATRDANGDITLGDSGVPAPTNFTMTGVVGGILFAWTNPSVTDSYDEIEVYASATSAFSGATKVATLRSDSFLLKVTGVAQRWGWVRSVRKGTQSIRNPDNDITTVQASSLSEAEGDPFKSAPFVEDFSDNSLPRALAWWSGIIHSTGENAIVAETAAPPNLGGRYVWQIGNNAGDDMQWRSLDGARAFSVKPGRLYRMTWDIRRALGGATTWLGVVCLAADRITFIPAQDGGLHWVAAANYAPPSADFVTKTGWMKRTGASTDHLGGVTTAAAPAILPATCHFIAPVFLFNWQNAPGIYQFSYCAIEEVSDAFAGGNIYDELGNLLKDVDIRNDKAVVSALAFLNANPGFDQQRTNPAGAKAPAAWYRWGTSNNLTYEDVNDPDVLRMNTSGGAVSNNAFPVNIREVYEVVLLIKDAGGSSTAAAVAVEEYDSELGTGKLAIGDTAASEEAEIQQRTREVGLAVGISLTTSYALLGPYQYIPTPTCKWASIALGDGGRDLRVEWFGIRRKQTAPVSGYHSYMNAGYDDFESFNSATFGSSGTVTITLDTAIKYSGTQSAKVVGPTSATTWGIVFADTVFGDPYPLRIPAGRRWLAIMSIRPSESTATGNDSDYVVSLEPFNIGDGVVSSAIKNFSGADEDVWQRVAFVLDATANVMQRARLRLFVTNGGIIIGSAPEFYVDAISLIDVTDLPQLNASVFPAEFIRAPGTKPATEGLRGEIRIASSAEAAAGSVTDAAITPATLAAVLATLNLPIVAYKTADETVNNSSTLQDDDELFVPVAASKSYAIELHVYVTCLASSSPDFKFEFSGPAGATISFSWSSINTTAAEGDSIAVGFGTPATSSLNGQHLMLRINAGVTVGGTGGNVRFRWAQNAAGAVDTIVKATSWMVAVPA